MRKYVANQKEKIASLEVSLKNSKTIDTVDLTRNEAGIISDGSSPSSHIKRLRIGKRTESYSKSKMREKRPKNRQQQPRGRQLQPGKKRRLHWIAIYALLLVMKTML